MHTLTMASVPFLIGKKIKWTAPVYDYNKQIVHTSEITGFDPSRRQPIVATGDLAFAFQEDGDLYMGDYGRYITYEIV